jgi:hypothetical protein
VTDPVHEAPFADVLIEPSRRRGRLPFLMCFANPGTAADRALAALDTIAR